MTRLSPASIRQLRFPRALRIGPPQPPPDLEDLIDAVGAVPCSPERPDVTETPLDDRTLAGVATGLWRVWQRLLPGRPKGERKVDEPRLEVRKEFRHVKSMWDTLAHVGVVIQDHDGEPYRTGQALEVLAFQPTPGLDDERVIETIRPSVYINGRTIQMGQVFVGTPETKEAEEPDRPHEQGSDR